MRKESCHALARVLKLVEVGPHLYWSNSPAAETSTTLHSSGVLSKYKRRAGLLVPRLLQAKLSCYDSIMIADSQPEYASTGMIHE